MFISELFPNDDYLLEGLPKRQVTELAQTPDSDDGSDTIQLYIDVAAKLNVKRYKPSTAREKIANAMASMVPFVNSDYVDYAYQVARKNQGLPHGLAEGFASPPPMKDMIAVSGAGEEIKAGDTIRTKKMQMVGKVEKIVADKWNENSDKVFFRVDDGRLMQTVKRNCVKISSDIDEAKGIHSKVKIVKGPIHCIGKIGTIKEVRHGMFKGAEKTYTVDYDYDESTGYSKSVQLPASSLRLISSK